MLQISKIPIEYFLVWPGRNIFFLKKKRTILLNLHHTPDLKIFRLHHILRLYVLGQIIFMLKMLHDLGGIVDFNGHVDEPGCLFISRVGTPVD